WTDKEINKEKKPEEADKAFILNSKRRKEKRKKYLELKEKQKEEKERERQEQIKKIQEERERQRKEKEELRKQLEEKKQEELKKKLELEKERQKEREKRKQELLKEREQEKEKRLEQVRKEKQEKLKKREEILELLKKKVEENKRLREKLLLEKQELKERRSKEKQKVLELKEKEKEEKERERQEQIKKIQEERERQRKEKEELRKQLEEKKQEELKKKLELEKERQKEREKRKLQKKLEQKNLRIKNKQNLFNFIRYKALLNQIEKEKNLLYTNLILYKKTIERQRKLELIEIAKKLEKERKEILLKKKEKIPVKEIKITRPEKEEIIRRKEEQQKIKTYIDNISKIVVETDKIPEFQLNDTKKNITNLINLKKKEILKKKRVKIVPEKAKIIPKEKVKVAVYKEPFNLRSFLRRNIFKFVFIVLIFAWIVELLLYLKKLVSPEERLKLIVGEMAEVRPAPEKKKEVIEEEKLVYYTKEKIDIEGKRDPFSTGRLTMEVMKKPTPTNIIYAKKPDVISIMKTQKFVSILKAEEKITEPEKPEVPKISPVEKPEVPKVSPVEKPIITKPEQVSISTKLSEIEKVPEVKTTPFILPQKECKLIYRGRMILEGVEYFFIEGEKKTYKVTIGDEVEGYRLMKREDKKLILSKEGLIYSIDVK
ncbi:MAG: hypothetical protein NC827_01030, partial [Candidatus Omnitrophica bacterium]|nr:hypothetical protein [Candidatus Omnitrophota bacterium]